MKKYVGVTLLAIIVLGFMTQPVGAGTLETVVLDDAKIAVENAQSMSILVAAGYSGVTVKVSATFSSNHGFALGAAIAGVYDTYLHKFVAFGRSYDWAEKDYDTWGPIDITKIYYNKNFRWTRGLQIDVDPYGNAAYVSTEFHLTVIKVVDRTWPLSSYTVLLYDTPHELVGIAIRNNVMT
ncbi:hypothetical protein [Thermococcus waiotapuensis]|uniref:Uncharacterized protein n=1 Tax=Thermococcus waiotapuensis TaxID=90909 RepID=A0AAE4NUB3_9EURY|nr:hypothetical protein [Thermococcus waiotapuensis]MDV3103994.1 hypothetical protein [Thermococcus waiotapuensis]